MLPSWMVFLWEKNQQVKVLTQAPLLFLEVVFGVSAELFRPSRQHQSRKSTYTREINLN